MRSRVGSTSKIKLDTLSAIKNFIRSVLPPSTNEQFIVINVGKNHIVKNYKIFEGVSHSLVNIDIKKLSEYIFAHQTGFYFFAHTHPEHIATPSDSDDSLFEKLTNFTDSLSIIMLDNLIFSDEEFYSYRYGLHGKYTDYEIDYIKHHQYNLKNKKPQISDEAKLQEVLNLEILNSVLDDEGIDF